MSKMCGLKTREHCVKYSYGLIAICAVKIRFFANNFITAMLISLELTAPGAVDLNSEFSTVKDIWTKLLSINARRHEKSARVYLLLKQGSKEVSG